MHESSLGRALSPISSNRMPIKQQESDIGNCSISLEPKTPIETCHLVKKIPGATPLDQFNAARSTLKETLVQQYIEFLNVANNCFSFPVGTHIFDLNLTKEPLQTCLGRATAVGSMALSSPNSPGIGARRADYILELREDSPRPFKSLEDLENIGLSSKQIQGILRKMVSGIFK
ncbi:hypothetical protein ACP4OV_028880 [Aristida adscensionis]